MQVALIVKNEEQVLKRCLDSVKDLGEIIICDTGSTDKTIEIAKKYGKVYTDYKWNDNFAEARNHVLSKCTDDWILSIDADEWLEEGHAQKLLEEIKKHKTAKVLNITLDYNGFQWHFPRVFRRCPEVYWKRRVHNVLSISKGPISDVKINVSYSPAHQQDPDRAYRILCKEYEENPQDSRTVYYLAREFYYRKNWTSLIFWLERYLKMGTWGPELADAWYLLAKAYWAMGEPQEAKKSCLQSLGVNANFKEACQMMADLSGPKNKVRWQAIAETANNEDTLFRYNNEKGKDYYDKLFKEQNDFSRYDEIHKKVAEWVGDKKVLDIGCGRADVSKYIKNYQGFDFSQEAIKIAGDKCWVGDLYDKKNYKDTDIYLCLEVLEHVDDKKVIDNIKGRFIFSVPSFKDPSHLRTYDERKVRNLGLKINNIIRFNWHGKWTIGEDTDNYILLVDATK